jgi:hypothetical protein
MTLDGTPLALTMTAVKPFLMDPSFDGYYAQWAA